MDNFNAWLNAAESVGYLDSAVLKDGVYTLSQGGKSLQIMPKDGECLLWSSALPASLKKVVGSGAERALPRLVVSFFTGVKDAVFKDPDNKVTVFKDVGIFPSKVVSGKVVFSDHAGRSWVCQSSNVPNVTLSFFKILFDGSSDMSALMLPMLKPRDSVKVFSGAGGSGDEEVAIVSSVEDFERSIPNLREYFLFPRPGAAPDYGVAVVSGLLVSSGDKGFLERANALTGQFLNSARRIRSGSGSGSVMGYGIFYDQDFDYPSDRPADFIDWVATEEEAKGYVEGDPSQGYYYQPMERPEKTPHGQAEDEATAMWGQVLTGKISEDGFWAWYNGDEANSSRRIRSGSGDGYLSTPWDERLRKNYGLPHGKEAYDNWAARNPNYADEWPWRGDEAFFNSGDKVSFTVDGVVKEGVIEDFKYDPHKPFAYKIRCPNGEVYSGVPAQDIVAGSGANSSRRIRSDGFQAPMANRVDKLRIKIPEDAERRLCEKFGVSEGVAKKVVQAFYFRAEETGSKFWNITRILEDNGLVVVKGQDQPYSGEMVSEAFLREAWTMLTGLDPDVAVASGSKPDFRSLVSSAEILKLKLDEAGSFRLDMGDIRNGYEVYSSLKGVCDAGQLIAIGKKAGFTYNDITSGVDFTGSAVLPELKEFLVASASFKPMQDPVIKREVATWVISGDELGKELSKWGLKNPGGVFSRVEVLGVDLDGKGDVKAPVRSSAGEGTKEAVYDDYAKEYDSGWGDNDYATWFKEKARNIAEDVSKRTGNWISPEDAYYEALNYYEVSSSVSRKTPARSGVSRLGFKSPRAGAVRSDFVDDGMEDDGYPADPDDFSEPEEGDFIVDESHGISVLGERWWEPFEDWNQAEDVIREKMRLDGFFPNVWIADDHGGYTLTSINSSGKTPARSGGSVGF